MKHFLSVLSFIIFLIATSGNTWAATVVVVAKNSPIEALDEQYIANIFLARTTRFPNGEKAIPIEIKGNQIRQAFYKQISGKTPAQLNAYWTTLVFTGKGKPPRGYSASQDVLAKIETQPGAITYLSSELVTSEMRVVYTI